MIEMTVHELHGLMQTGTELLLIDVRENWERDIASIGGVHIPLAELSLEKLNELQRAASEQSRLVLYCHHGIRSLYVVKQIKEHIANAFSLRGGIDAWAREVDNNVPLY